MTELAAAYARWRSSPRGRIAERLERDLVLSLPAARQGQS